ncbi:ABC transporter substrate-binding protein [Puniceibacterium sp. IMCC21224]|uniref:ABC transporter substrate-binding protein n=1 Tax=Puniceibacterium sp. IMCC21224 TaxID=1618204 RepID=UPI00065CE492|nr:ABC transporter substrate-binding protein [Puniceibacterium sp. IMCC21224]KMK66988.1 amino acid/amide ABC transporter substrate-binding protein, HAAT family [Puniceibacterium sp. IMCC21224]
MQKRCVFGWLGLIFALGCGPVFAGDLAGGLAVGVTYLRHEVAPPPTLSNLDPEPADRGVAGAALGMQENATTGQFLGQHYSLDVVSIPEGGDFLAAVRAALTGSDLLLLDAPAEDVLAAADLPGAAKALFLNVSAADSRLRGSDCRTNLLHTLPSLDMRADALVQMLVQKRWRDVAMITGPNPVDHAFADAIEASIHKFGLEIGSRADWDINADMRRNAAAEVPLLTQALGDFDVLIVADEAHDFGRFVQYNTWLPRPVAGSEGLVPRTWAPVIEQWGAAQLQARFSDHAGRAMSDEDYAAWAAVRAIGEAVTRTGRTDAVALRAYLLGDDFELGGFKGSPMTFRAWNGQMRQPIALVHPRALVATAPFDGFLHQRNPLDTLGLDESEAGCEAFQ